MEEHLKAINLHHPVVVLSAFENETDEINIKEEPFLEVQVLYRKKWPIYSHYKALKKGYQVLLDRDYNFDLAHLHVCWPSGIVFLGFLKRLPFIVTEHYSGYQSYRRSEWSRFAQALARRVLNRAKIVCPVSNQLGQAFHEFGVKTPQVVVGNTVDTDLFHFSPKTESDTFQICHISSLQEKTKNIKGILRAFEMALKQEPNLKLAIGGDGDLERLKELIKQKRINMNQIEILGAMSREEVKATMAANHAFLLFSFVENQPVVILESLCLGRPVLASKVGGIPEILDEENGILVDSRDEEGLAEAILEMKRNYSQYTLENISQEAIENYSYVAIGKKFAGLYASVRP